MADNDYPWVVPQNLEEANGIVERIGELLRENIKIKTALDAEIAARREAATKETTVHNAQVDRLMKSLQIYANLHRHEIEAEGRRSASVPGGSFGWRLTPPSVSIPNGNEAEVIEMLQAAPDFREFLRIPEPEPEINRRAMVENQELAEKVPGVQIVQRELFFVKPATTDTELTLESRPATRLTTKA